MKDADEKCTCRKRAEMPKTYLHVKLEHPKHETSCSVNLIFCPLRMYSFMPPLHTAVKTLLEDDGKRFRNQNTSGDPVSA